MDKFVKRIPKKTPEQNYRLVPNTSFTETNGNMEESGQDGIEATKSIAGDASNLIDDVLKTELQRLEFSSSLLSDLRLMEINPELVDRIKAEEQLVFRGDLEDNPVLCTKEQTYDVKEVVTTHSILLLPEFHFSNEANASGNSITMREVVGMKNNYVELRAMKYVSCTRLKEMLHEGELEWNEGNNKKNKLYTFPDLLTSVQMSQMELHKTLERMPIITLNGFVRLLSADYRDHLVTELVDCMDDEEEPGITLESVGVECLKEALKKRLLNKSIPVEATEWLIKTHCDVVEENGTRRYIINEKAICRAKISQLLRAAVRFEYSTFEKTLEQILPVGVEFKEHYLEGIAFIDDELTTGKTIRYLNIEDLPDDPIKRLEVLFSLRQSWKISEMGQYMSDLCPTTRLLNEMFMNYCQQSTDERGEKVLTGLKETLF